MLISVRVFTYELRQNFSRMNIDIHILTLWKFSCSVGSMTKFTYKFEKKNPSHNHFFSFSFAGCFAGGVYLALWFTILQPNLETEEKYLSVLALFPIVSIMYILLSM